MTISSPTKPVFSTPHFISTSTFTKIHHYLCHTMIPFGGQTTLPALVWSQRGKRSCCASIYQHNPRQKPSVPPEILSTLNWRLGPVSLTLPQSSVFWLLGHPLSPQYCSPHYYLPLHGILHIWQRLLALAVGSLLALRFFPLFPEVSQALTLPTGNQNCQVTLFPFWNLKCSHTHSYLTDFLTTPLPLQTVQFQNIFWPDQTSGVTSLGLSYLEVIWVLA